MTEDQTLALLDRLINEAQSDLIVGNTNRQQYDARLAEIAAWAEQALAEVEG